MAAAENILKEKGKKESTSKLWTLLDCKVFI
jgi:hypothetical protein